MAKWVSDAEHDDFGDDDALDEQEGPIGAEDPQRAFDFAPPSNGKLLVTILTRCALLRVRTRMKLARAAECLIYSLTPGGFWAAKRPKISDLRGFPRHFAMGPARQRRRLQNSDRGVEIEPEVGSR